jgi:endonuclease/exonuclease/phosphatase (EEP) superfamily protein YafD
VRVVARVAAGTLLAAVAALLLVLVRPDLVGLAGTEPFAQLVALRGLQVAGLLVGAVLLGALGGLLRLRRDPGPDRGPGRRTGRRGGSTVALVCAGALLLGAGGHVAVLAGRGADGSGPGAPADADLVVLSFNTFDAVTAEQIADLVRTQDADVAVLPETSGATARAAARALTQDGRPTTALAADAAGTRVEGTALLVRAELGAFSQVTAGLPAADLGTFAAVPTVDAPPPGIVTTGYTVPRTGDTPLPGTVTTGYTVPRIGDTPLPGTVTTGYTVDAVPGNMGVPARDTAYTVDTVPGDVGVPARDTVDTTAPAHAHAHPVDPVDPADPADHRRVAPPTLVATHLRAPSARASMHEWRAHTAGIAAVCRSTPGVVVAGDLNATLDHPGLRDLGPCVDAAVQAGAGALGTWPARVPSVLGAPIDHVLVDGRAWRVTGFAVLPAVGGSDHRPVVAHLARR